MKNLKIIFEPAEKNISEIEVWGLEKSYLYKSFREKTLIVAEIDNITVGFYCLNIIKNELAIKIETAEIKDEYRNKGIGKFIFDEILKKYRRRKYYCFTLYCSPKESQFYWKKLGFDYFPANKNSNKIEMFRAIKNINKQVENFDSYSNTIEILDDYSTSYKWKFDFEDNTNKLKLPIIFFGNYKWKMILRINGKVIYSDEYRRFDKNSKIDSCVFIKSIPEKFLNH